MLLLYLLSGFSGLLYEIVWARLLALYIGHTAGAISTVLAAFMGGLAAGAFVAGGYAGRLTRRNALRAYAVVELLVALCALALPLAVTASLPLLSGMYGDAPSAAFGAARVILCLALITVPAALMGATYPLAVRAAGSATAAPGGRMYAANTAGAALGAIATGFLLLPWLGNFRTTVVGAVVNATAAGGAWWLSMSQSDEAAPVQQIRHDRVRRETAVLQRPRLAMTAVFVSGAVALLCEVAWTRVFAMILGPTTYAFATMLAAFIGGIAVGAVAGVRLGHRPGAVGTLGWSLLVAGAGTAAGLAVISQVPLLVGEWTAPTSAQFLPVLLREAAVAGAVLLPATGGFGAAFPLALAVGARAEHAATDASRIYAANTAGAIAGSLAGGFVLIPAAGLRGTLVIAAAAALAAGVAVLLSDRHAAVRLKPDTTGATAVRLKPDTTGGAAVRLKPDTTGGARRRPYVGIATAAGVGAWLALSPGWNTALLSSGVYKYAPYLGTMDLREVLEAGEVLYYREGAAGAVSVRRSGAVLSLSIDGKVDASNGGDMLTQKLLAHLPLLLHSSPKRVAVVGLGSGVTAGAALVHPVDHLDVIEISPEVVEASRLFDSFSGQPLRDPRTRLLVGDARTHLSLGRRGGAYDVIISEPSNPWMAGVASLFTREFFEMAAARIAPGGVMCQWTHTYDIDAADLKKIIATFQAVFSDTSLWLVGDADLLLIGRVAPAADMVTAIERGFQRPGVAGDLRAVGARSPSAIISLFAGDSAAARTYAAGAPVETDDRLGLEFSGPRSIVGRNEGGNAKELRVLAASTSRPASLAAALAAASPADWRDRGTMLLTARSTAAFDAFSRAVAGGDEQALPGLREAALTSGMVDEAAAIMRHAADTHVRSPAALLELSRLLAAAGDPAAALRAAQDALARDTTGRESLRQIASVLADAGDRDGLNAFLEELRRADPAGADTRYYEAVSAFLNGSFQSAARDGEAALAIDPRHARARNLVGVARARLGDADGARRAFRESIAAAPDDPAPHVNLGALALEAGDTRRAITHFSEALAMDSHSPAAREGIAAALELEGDHARARRIRSKPLVPRIQQSR